MTARKGRPDGRRCRTILATALGAFFLAQLVAGFVIDWGYPEVRFREMHQRLAALRLEPRTPDLVFFGSSRFQSALSPDELTHELRRATGKDDFRAFSMAVPCGDPIAMERVFVEMRNGGIRPPTVLLEMTPFSLLQVNLWYSTHAVRQLDLADLPECGVEMTRSGNFGRFFLNQAMPLYVHRHHALKNLVAPATIAAPEPLGPPDKMSDEEMARLLEAGAIDDGNDRKNNGLHELERALRNYTVGGASVRALERILTMCAQDGTRVILIGSPLTSGYRKLHTAQVEVAYRAYLDGVAERFGVPFVDCRDALPDSLMVDYHHVLGPEGRIVFTRYAARAVLGPWLRGRSTAPIHLVHRSREP